MSDGEENRLIAWNRELEAAHQRLREALQRAKHALDVGDVVSVRGSLVLYCQGFCAALKEHHVGEGVALFPELSARHPTLKATIAKLEQDHTMIASLLTQFDHALTSSAPPDELSLHLNGLSAIMESHFRYEERQLLDVLSALDLVADPRALLSPL
jgi:hemerythrin-like domain-containing protein